MEDTTVSIIGILIASVLMFMVPLYTIADRNDDISQLTVQTETALFVDNVIRLGKITATDYQQYISSLNASGNSYDIEMELKILDTNLTKNVTVEDLSKIGENVYYSLYTSQIEDKLLQDESENPSKGVILLKEGDRISVTAKNSSKTLSQSLKSFYYTISGSDLHIISGASSGTIAVNGTT